MKLGELAQALDLELRGDPEYDIHGVASLEAATAHQLSFLSSSRFSDFLADTAAGVVILRPEMAQACAAQALISDNPHLSYARAAALLHPQDQVAAGIDANAWVDDAASVAASAAVAAGCVVLAGASIADDVQLGPNCVVAENCRVGRGSRLVANVTLCRDTVIGADCLIQPGAVIGSNGFGLAKNDLGEWERVPQLGRVVIGDRVDVGANTTIDRGALGDTVIHDGVKLDNLIQIAHNVEIGANTAMAACAAVAGSSRIGGQCTLAGGSGVVGHVELADGVHVGAYSLVNRSLSDAGAYVGSMPTLSRREWGRNTVHLRHLDEMAKRVRALEKQLSALLEQANADSEQPND